MATQRAFRDPRSIVTPDAFELSAGLLGTPLAPPSKRLAALLVDLVVIGLITLLTRNFGLILGIVAAVFFIRAGFKRTPVRGSAFNRAMRLSVGCLGLWIGILTAVVWASVGFGGGDGDDEAGIDADGDGSVTVSASGVSGAVDVLALIRDGARLRSVTDAEEAEGIIGDLVRRAAELGIPDSDVPAAILDVVPDDAPWSDAALMMVERALAGRDSPTEIEPDPAPAANDSLLEQLAGDTLRSLALRLDEAEDLAAERLIELQRTRDELEEASSRGAFDWIRGVADDLGLGLGWGTLYLTVVLSWWKGQTVGKRLLGIRVVRLDGEPLTWWTAFERVGGYAAGLATGLLGFAQVFWDSNRQAIHDRIVGTVVIVDGAEKIENWKEAM